MLTFFKTAWYDVFVLEFSAGFRSPMIPGGHTAGIRFGGFFTSKWHLLFMGGHAGSRKACRFLESGLRTRMVPPALFEEGERKINRFPGEMPCHQQYPHSPQTKLSSSERLQADNTRLISENEVMIPKARFADAVTASDDCILIREQAKILRGIRGKGYPTKSRD